MTKSLDASNKDQRSQYLSKFLTSKVSGIPIDILDTLINEGKLQTYKMDRYGDKLCIQEVLNYKDKVIATEEDKKRDAEQRAQELAPKADKPGLNEETEFSKINYMVNSDLFEQEKEPEYILTEVEFYDILTNVTLFQKNSKGDFIVYKAEGVDISGDRKQIGHHPPLYIHKKHKEHAAIEVISGLNSDLKTEFHTLSPEALKKKSIDICSNAFANPINKVLLMLEETASIMVHGYTKDTSLLKKIYSQFLNDDALAEHSINVMNLCIKFCLNNNYSLNDIEAIALSALLHDIGKVQTHRRMLKSKYMHTSDEQLILKAHTVWGYKMLEHCPFSNQNVKFGAIEHHEYVDGSGYPKGTKKTSFYGQLISIVNNFDMLLMAAKQSGRRTTHLDILKNMKTMVDEGRFNSDLFRQFAYSLL